MAAREIATVNTNVLLENNLKWKDVADMFWKPTFTSSSFSATAARSRSGVRDGMLLYEHTGRPYSVILTLAFVQ